MIRRVLGGPRIMAGIAAWVLFGLGAGLIVAAGAPVIFGMHAFTVMSGSMAPALGVGDVVVEHQIPATAARPGDIITFHDPDVRGRMLTHRLTAIHIVGDRALVDTKGDVNNHAERWSIAARGSLGRVSYHLPLLGYGLVWTSGRYARIALVVVPACILGMIELLRIWRPRRREEEAADAVA
jgi:signal peptidase